MPNHNVFTPSPYLAKNANYIIVCFLRSLDDTTSAIQRLHRKDYTGFIRVPCNATCPVSFTGVYMYSSAAIMSTEDPMLETEVEHYQITGKIACLPPHPPGLYRITNIEGRAIEVLSFLYQRFLYGPAISKDDVKYDTYLEYKAKVCEAWANVDVANKLPTMKKRKAVKEETKPRKRRATPKPKQTPRSKSKSKSKSKAIKVIRQRRQAKARRD